MHKTQTIRNIRQNMLIEFTIIYLKYSQVDDSHSISDHGLGVIGELLGHHQKWEMLILLIIEELDGVLVEKQGQRFDEGYIDIDQLLIVEVEVEFYQLVQERVAKDVVCKILNEKRSYQEEFVGFTYIFWFLGRYSAKICSLSVSTGC